MTKIAIVGAGAITRRGHLPALAKLAHAEVSLVELNPDLLQRVKDEFGIQETFTDYERVLQNSEVEVVGICTPTPTHRSLIVQALQAGKHVLVEKPLALDLDDAVKIYQAAKEHERNVGIVQNYRYFSAVHQARLRLADGYLGRTVSMNGLALTRFPNGWTHSRWLYNPRGALTDFAPHLLDLVRWLNDQPLQHVVAFGGDFSDKGRMGFVTNAQAILSFAGGTTATVDISWLTGTLMFGLDLHGTCGHLFLDVRGNNLHETHGTITPFNDLGWFYKRLRSVARGLRTGEFFAGAMAFYEVLWNEFLQSLEQGDLPPVPIQDGIWVNTVIDAIYTSLQTGQPVNIQAFLVEKGLNEQAVEEILQPAWKFHSSEVLEVDR